MSAIPPTPPASGDTTASVPRPTIVLIHGAWHGAWCWTELRSELTLRGLRTEAIDLPSTSPGRSSPAGMHDDAEAISQVLGSIDGPVLLVAHSYGGIPATQVAATADNVVHLVYVAAFRLLAEQSLRSFSGIPAGDSPYLPVPDNPVQLFYNDAKQDEAQRCASQLVPQSSRSFSELLTHGAEEVTSASYVICQNDQVLQPSSQQQMAVGLRSVSMMTGHSPFIVDPAGLANLLAGEADACTGRD